MDKGTVIRTAVLAVALFNQVLAVFEKSPLPFSQQEVIQSVSALFTVIASVVAWFKNNYVTEKGKSQKTAIDRAGVH